MRRALLTCALIALLQSRASAQERPWGFFGGFTWHELQSPGFHLGGEYAIEASRHFRALVAAALQAYFQPDVESGYAIQLRWGQRYTADFGLTFDHYLGIGVQYTRWETTEFEFEDSVGHASSHTTSGFAFVPHVVFGPGYDFARVLGVPLSLAARPGVILLYPDMNEAFELSFIVEFSLRWTPDL